MAKTIGRNQQTKKNKSRKKLWQVWKSVAQISEQCCGKTMEYLRNRIGVKLVSNEKDYLNKI